MYYEEKTAEKPEKWPANAREQILDTLCECVEEFKKNPSYKTREVLLSLTCEHDLNLNENFGLVRVTEYEVGILNFLYLVGNAYQISSLKTYIYNIITQVTRLQKITSWFNPVINCDEENTYRVIPYEQGLIFPLRLYHIVYQKFTIEKNKSFAEQLIEIVEETLKSCQTEEEIDTLTHSYTSMLLDISNMHGSKREKLWEFTREELYKLLAIEAKLLRMNKQPANIRPVTISGVKLQKYLVEMADMFLDYSTVEYSKNLLKRRTISWLEDLKNKLTTPNDNGKIEQDLKALEGKRGKLIDLYTDELISKEEFKSRSVDLDAEIEKKRALLVPVEENPDIKAIEDTIANIDAEIEALFEDEAMVKEKKVQFIQEHIKKIYVSKNSDVFIVFDNVAGAFLFIDKEDTRIEVVPVAEYNPEELSEEGITENDFVPFDRESMPLDSC